MLIRKQECGSAVNGRMATGCEHCFKGSKMVLLVTGRCNTGCFYCPVSEEKKGKDSIYANERKVHSNEEIIEEAVSMNATGTGITGGDPLVVFDRTLGLIKLLKERFGPEHHIHLYTSMMDPDMVERLAEAGLDEIRFHPSADVWKDMSGTPLEKITSIDIDVGIEVPALPGKDEELECLITYAFEAGVKFVNLNELEFSESNWDMMEKYNLEPADELSSAVLGSRDTAMRLMKKLRKYPIHFCSSAFKDGVQLRNRLIRRAQNTAKAYEVITEDGTILKGILYTDDIAAAEDLLKKEYEVPDELIFADADRIETAPWVLEKLADRLPYKCYVVEEYSTADRLEVERTPLN